MHQSCVLFQDLSKHFGSIGVNVTVGEIEMSNIGKRLGEEFD